MRDEVVDEVDGVPSGEVDEVDEVDGGPSGEVDEVDEVWDEEVAWAGMAMDERGRVRKGRDAAAGKMRGLGKDKMRGLGKDKGRYFDSGLRASA